MRRAQARLGARGARSRWLSALLGGLVGALATLALADTPAYAGGGHLAAAEEHVGSSEKQEVSAIAELAGGNGLGAEEDLGDSQRELQKAIQETEAAFAAGEIQAREAAEVTPAISMAYSDA